MLELTPGLLDWLAVILTVVAGAPAVRHPGGCADLNTVFSTADVEDSSEQLLRQQSHAIKNQLGHKVTSMQGQDLYYRRPNAMPLHVGSLNVRYVLMFYMGVKRAGGTVPTSGVETADLDTTDQRPPLHVVPAPGEVTLGSSLAAPRTEHWDRPRRGNSLTASL